MLMQILNGQEVAQIYKKRISLKVDQFAQKFGCSPSLAVVLVGKNPASHIYVNKKQVACKKAGIIFHRYNVDQNETSEKLETLLDWLNNDPSVHGILVQLPLPKSFDRLKILQKISPLKDVDGLTFDSIGRLFAGQARIEPCTPQGIMAILKHYNIKVAGQKAVVIGRSQIVGKPIFEMLTKANATVTLCHSKTVNISSFTQQADLVVVATGQAEMLGQKDFKKDAVVIDVGIHRRKDGSLCGDVRFDELDGHVFAATPVPGGVGPMTVTMLLQNTLNLAIQQENIKRSKHP